MMMMTYPKISLVVLAVVVFLLFLFFCPLCVGFLGAPGFIRLRAGWPGGAGAPTTLDTAWSNNRFPACLLLCLIADLRFCPEMTSWAICSPDRAPSFNTVLAPDFSRGIRDRPMPLSKFPIPLPLYVFPPTKTGSP